MTLFALGVTLGVTVAVTRRRSSSGAGGRAAGHHNKGTGRLVVRLGAVDVGAATQALARHFRPDRRPDVGPETGPHGGSEPGPVAGPDAWLGDVAQAELAPDLEWFDRAALRRRPLAVALRARRRRYADAVLLASDLEQPRLRLTSLLLALPAADRKWRIDLRGRREVFSTGAHVAHNAVPVARHALACALAWLLGEPVLRAIAALIEARPPVAATPRTSTAARAKGVTRRIGGGGRPTGSIASTARPSTPAAERAPGASPAPEGATDGSPAAKDATGDSPPAATTDRARPRILYLRSQFWLGLAGGGSVAHTAGVIRGLTEAGARVHVVTSDQLPGVHVAADVVRPETWFDGNLREVEEVAYNVPFSLAAWRAARRFAPDVIYHRHTAFNCAGAVLGRLLRRPLVLEFNSSELWKGQYWGGLGWRRAAALVERINLAAADRVVVVSEVLRDDLLRRGVADARIVVNPNAVDPATFGPHVDGSVIRQRVLGGENSGDGRGAAVVVGFSGTFGNWHGIPTLATVLPRVVAARPRVHWLLIGDGPLRDLIDDAVARDYLAANAHLPGLVPHGHMPAYLAACDVLVAPHGRQADGGEFFGSPTKLFEYMAAGRAIVASAVGQMADVLEHERTALLVPPDDPSALCDAIVRLVDDPALRERLGGAAREQAVAHHTWRQNAERLLASLPCSCPGGASAVGSAPPAAPAACD